MTGEDELVSDLLEDSLPVHDGFRETNDGRLLAFHVEEGKWVIADEADMEHLYNVIQIH